MEGTQTVFTETADLIAKYDELIANENHKFIVYLTGGVDETGKNWCSDCEAAGPNIQAHCLTNAAKNGVPVLKGVVNDKTTWCGRADHPYKMHAKIKAGGVPSVILFCDGQQTRADCDDHFNNEDLLKMIACEE